MDKIIARGLEFKGCHGVYTKEKLSPQSFRVDLELYLDLRPAAEKDDLNLTLDYGKAFALVKDIVEKQSYNLIETLAEKIAADLLETFGHLQAVEVQVVKPEAPVGGSFEYFAVKIKRGK